MRGLADELVDRGMQVSQVRPRPSRRTTLRLLLDHPESRFRYVLVVAQAQTEKLLEQRATELGVPISRGAELVGLHQDEAGVELVLSTADGTVTERARYAVGCDGAHSAVRRLLGVGFTGSAYDTNILLADVRLGASLEAAVNVFVSKDGLVLLPTFGDGWYRAVIWDRRQEEVPLDTPLHLEEIIEPLRRITGHDLWVREMRWSTRFLTERRQADRYRVGRVLLAGDAAHVHSAGDEYRHPGRDEPGLEAGRRRRRLGTKLAPGLLPHRTAPGRTDEVAPDRRAATSRGRPGAGPRGASVHRSSRVRAPTLAAPTPPHPVRVVSRLPAAATRPGAPLDWSAGTRCGPRGRPAVPVATPGALPPP